MAGLSDLERRCQRALKEVDRFLEGFLTQMALRALTKTKKRTPVDTGNLRNSWAIGEIERSGDTLSISLYNPVEYATYVEYGHKRTAWGSKSSAETSDWVEGRFMATLSLNNIEKEMPARYEKAFKAWLEGL